MTNERESQKPTGTLRTDFAIFSRLAIQAALVMACAVCCPDAARAAGVATNLPSDTPQSFKLRTEAFDYVKRE